jgi:serine/threonine-protein kinase
MGSVYLGYAEDQKRVAIKILSDQLASNEDYVARFYREAKSGALLNHPNMVRCIKVGQDEPTGKHYLILEFVDGPSAQALLERMGKLPVGDAVHLILDVARALEHAHSRNIIHRDIKPDNILITPSGVAKLADLGLAKRTDEASNLTALRQGFGTLHYIPCEQAFNAKNADCRSDIYALGATLYHLVTGEVPFPGNSPVEIAEKKQIGTFLPAHVHSPEVPPALDAIIGRMMAREPADRYQLVSELIVDLERADLASVVPSFADPELARQDPLVQAYLNSQPTQLDVENGFASAAGTAVEPDVWYLRFRNRAGAWCKTKLSAQQVRERLADGRIPAGAEISPDVGGDYRPVAVYPQFRVPKAGLGKPGHSPARPEAKIPAPEQAPAPVSNKVPKRNTNRWLWATGLGMAVVTALLLVAAGYKLFMSP